MTHQIVIDPPKPGSLRHARMITASKIPVILGLTPQWQTPSELWMIMSGLAEPEQLKGDHLDWGHVAEASLVDWWKHKNPGWRTGKEEIAYTDTALPFDNLATLDRRAVTGRAFRIIECKTSVDASLWDSEEALPGHVHTQVLAQMGISGIHRADVVSQLGSTVPRIFPVEWEEDLWVGIVEHVKAFVDTLGNSEPPMPPADLLEALKPEEPPTNEIVVEHDEVADILVLQSQIKDLEAELEHAKETLVTQHGGAKLTVDGKVFLSPSKGRFSAKRVPEEARHLLMDPDVQKTAFDATLFAKKYPDVAKAATGETSYKLLNIA